MGKNNFFTPDRDINPPDDAQKKDCIDCNGTGTIIEWDEDDMPDHVPCPTCKGEGQIEKDDFDDDDDIYDDDDDGD